LILDQYGNVIHANAIFLNWLGMSEAEIAGRYCFDLVRRLQADNSSTSPESGRAFVKHEGDPGALINEYFPEGTVKHSQSGKAVEVLLHLQPITTHDNKISGYILVVRDKSLRSEIAGLKMEIVTMLARAIRGPLMSAEKEWQSILAVQGEGGQESLIASTGEHDIATISPQPDKVKLEELHEQLNRELNQELKPVELTFVQRLAGLHARYKNLISSVETLLSTHGRSIGQLMPLTNESGSFTALDLESVLLGAEPSIETFPISRLVGECLRETMNLAQEKQLSLDHKTSTALPNITGNRALMKSILSPIIEKMISVTAPGGKVRVESVEKDKEIQVSVSSSGPALSEEEIVDMFSGFVSGKHDEDSYGSRLALYLARNNAERSGATVWAQSEAANPSEAGPQAQSEDQSGSASAMTIYIAFPIS